MALTFSIVTRTLHPEGGKRMNVVDITFDSSYPTGGEAVTPNQLGLNTIDRVLPFPGYAASNPWKPRPPSMRSGWMHCGRPSTWSIGAMSPPWYRSRSPAT